MNRRILLMGIALLAGGCTEERVIYDNTPNAKFAAMLGGKRNASGEVSGAWQVSGHNTSDKPVSEGAQRIAEIIRGQIASPKGLPPDTPGSNLKITTSFDLADQPNSPNGGAPQDTGPYIGVPNLYQHAARRRPVPGTSALPAACFLPPPAPLRKGVFHAHLADLAAAFDGGIAMRLRNPGAGARFRQSLWPPAHHDRQPAGCRLSS